MIEDEKKVNGRVVGFDVTRNKNILSASVARIISHVLYEGKIYKAEGFKGEKGEVVECYFSPKWGLSFDSWYRSSRSCLSTENSRV